MPSSCTTEISLLIRNLRLPGGAIIVPVELTEAADTAKVLFECAQNKDSFGESQAAFVLDVFCQMYLT